MVVKEKEEEKKKEGEGGRKRMYICVYIDQTLCVFL